MIAQAMRAVLLAIAIAACLADIRPSSFATQACFAMAQVRQATMHPDKHPWVAKLLGRMSKKQAAIAIANKTARIAWAIMVHGGVYEAGHRAPQYRAQACAAAG